MTVASLRWTAHGAVAAPETLQLRLERDHPGRVSFGAPTPTRALSDEEVLHNVRAFQDPGPRGRPVLAAVLGGVSAARQLRLPGLIEEIGRVGVARITVHLSAPLAQPLAGAVVVSTVRSLQEARGLPVAVQVGVPLESDVLERLPALIEALGPGRRVTLMWPFPGGAIAPHRDQVLLALRAAAGALADVDWGLKGLPACTLGELLPGIPDIGVRTWRSANRWYVDADHQLRGALLLRPDLLTFDKPDSCRFCTAFAKCDGAASEWVRAGLTGPMLPLREGGP